MMETCVNKDDRREQEEMDDLNNLQSEFSMLPDTQQSNVEEKEHLQVYLRVRPFTAAEKDNGESQDCVTIEPPDTVLLRPPSLALTTRLSTDKSLTLSGQHFQFSQVYGPDTTQRELFEGTAKDLVKDVLEGGNSLIFTYGVTNAGKTFTFLGPDADAGILPRSLDLIFSTIDEHVFTGKIVKPQRCREFTKLTRDQQAEEAAFKKNLLRQLKESDKGNVSLLNSTKILPEGCSVVERTVVADDRMDLEVEPHIKFSVWVSFCEIYNENIHDLLDVVPSGTQRRTALRLSQDIMGNTFVKDLHWVQVNSAQEAYKLMKLGKKNQSFSSTRLNQLSSRSHSIFSIRILKIEDTATPRVHTVSELCLCDLAGSERCAKTQNKGERLKEAGNINTSLLILGKCISALRHNQQAKLLQHVPFRESKLTHYLQSFFCGRGKACMVVNINQCASMYDETLNVLKFSAVAQKVVVLSTRPLTTVPQRSSGEVSFLRSRRSSLIGRESSLEDVQEDDEEKSLTEDTMNRSDDENDENDQILISKKMYQQQTALLKQLRLQLKNEQANALLMETQAREEISREFSELFCGMQTDFNDRLQREREILEERAERRLEIFKNLIDSMGASGPTRATDKPVGSSSSDLAGVKNTTEVDHKDSAQGGELCADVDELKKRILELNEHYQDKLDHKPCGEASGVEVEEKKMLVSQLQEKSSEVLRLEKRMADLQMVAECSSSLEKDERSREKQELLATIEVETRAREDALDALEYQTMVKEETLISLEEERKRREETLVTLKDMEQSNKEALAFLEGEKRAKEEAVAALDAERRAKDDAVKALAEERRSREELVAALSKERLGREELQAALTVERQEIRKLLEDSERRQQEVSQLALKLELTERQVTSETQKAEQASVELNAALAKVDEHFKEIQDQNSQIHTLTEEVQRLKQELQTTAAAHDSSDQVTEEVVEVVLVEQEEKHLHVSDQHQEKLHKPEAATQRGEEPRIKPQEKEEMLQQPLLDTKAELECEVTQLKAKLEELAQNSEKQVEDLKGKLRDHEVRSQKQLVELELKLSEEKATSDQLREDLKQKLSEKELLNAKLQEATSSSAAAKEELQRLNSDLQNEVASLRAKVSNMEEDKTCPCDSEPSPFEMEKLLKEKEDVTEQKLADSKKVSAEREAELKGKLRDVEVQVTSLQKRLEEAQEQRGEEESQAVQEARRREVERRRELLAVAHEAIAQKDAELEKRAEEIRRLKETAKQDGDKVKNLSLDLQRKEEHTSDLREKLADYKKQIQQVQKEISSMKDEEKLLRQKLSDAEKVKKQLQSDLASRDRTIQQLKVEQSSDLKCDQTLQLYQKACKDLEAKERVAEDMRLALMEQEETQEQMEQVLEQKLNLIQELSSEVDKLKGILLQQAGGSSTSHHTDDSSGDLRLAKKEAAQAHESLQLCVEKHQAERKKWLEEKLALIGQVKEAEEKRNQEMRKFAEDRERYTRQQSQMESQMSEKNQTMDTWRKERDTLVAALEVQLQKLLCSQAEKDQVIQQLRQNNTQEPPEGGRGGRLAELQAALAQREVEISQLKEDLKATKEMKNNNVPAPLIENPQSETIIRKSGGRRNGRASVSSQGSSGFPCVLDSSEISTENGRMSRFPQPELEISFSPLQPNRMALRRQGEESAVTVKITRSARKRKSGEMEKEAVEAENKRNTKTKLKPKMAVHQEELSPSAGRQESQSSIRSRKEGTLQKIGDFLQSSPTLLGTKAKKMMSLVSGRNDADLTAASSTSPSLSLRAKKKRKQLYRPDISAPMDIPSHPIISSEPEEKESDHQIIKRRLRSRIVK